MTAGLTHLRPLGALAAALALTVQPVMAQDTGNDPDPAENEIIVEGEISVDQRNARQQARDVTNARGSTTQVLARFNDEICPGVWGLSPENAQLVIDRIYDNAERAGAQLEATEDCRANLWVIFVNDPRETFQQMRDDDAFLLDGINIWQRRRILEQEGPALAWQTTLMRTEGGGDRSLGDPSNQVYSMSRLDTGMTNDIEISVVLIDRSVLADVDAFAVADYATMRALAQTRPPREEGEFDTVLALFDEDAPGPNRLSAFDISYLRSLYRGRGTGPSTRAHSGIDRLMEDELNREQ
ncbi:hypothetical protein [Erythrobacter alti]|uniref:hypothetical protein n=1 Tax=Erythrobacter alti TaxID=1896145 RepID=UPI0030F41E71